MFKIVGEVIDRDRDKLILFGKAIPMGGNMDTYGAVLRDASLVVMNPQVQGMPRKYVGDHHFLRKTKGVNAYNAPVPVWVYGGLPKPVLDKVQPLSGKIQKLDMDLKADKIDYHKIGKALKGCVME